MSEGLLWLPTPVTLDPSVPDIVKEWCDEHSIPVFSFEEEGIDFAAVAKAAETVDVLLCAVDARHESWLEALLSYRRKEIVVYGPGRGAVRCFREGRPSIASTEHELYRCDEIPKGDFVFFEEARRNGYSPELSALNRPARLPGPKTRWFAFEGADGAGKTSQANHLAQTLGGSVQRSCRSGDFYIEVSRLLHATVLCGDRRGWRWGRLWKIFDSMRILWNQFDSAGEELIVWDRYMATHLGACFMRFQDDAGFAPWLETAPQCRNIVYLDLPEEESAKRRAARVDQATLDEHALAQMGYRRAFQSMAGRGKMILVDAKPSESIVQHAVLQALKLDAVDFALGQTTRHVTPAASVVFEQNPPPQSLHLDCGRTPSDLVVSPDSTPGMDWHGFLRAIDAAGPTLPLSDRIDLLAFELDRRLRSGAEQEQTLVFPLWPPLLRAVHGLRPGYEPSEFRRLDPIPWRFLEAEEVASCWDPFFRSESCRVHYLEEAKAQSHSSEQQCHAVVGAILFDPEGRLLLERRNAAKSLYPGYWDTPGGKLNVGEKPEEACGRELEEEYGVTLQPRQLHALPMLVEQEPTRGFLMQHHPFVVQVQELPTVVGPDAVEIWQGTPEEALELPGLATPVRQSLGELLTLGQTSKSKHHVH
jgi:8-oxo-dGTP pyrophosphatase MutT (NUDIX family)/thymidylate kinase